MMKHMSRKTLLSSILLLTLCGCASTSEEELPPDDAELTEANATNTNNIEASVINNTTENTESSNNDLFNNAPSENSLQTGSNVVSNSNSSSPLNNDTQATNALFSNQQTTMEQANNPAQANQAQGSNQTFNNTQALNAPSPNVAQALNNVGLNTGNTNIFNPKNLPSQSQNTITNLPAGPETARSSNQQTTSTNPATSNLLQPSTDLSSANIQPAPISETNTGQVTSNLSSTPYPNNQQQASLPDVTFPTTSQANNIQTTPEFSTEPLMPPQNSATSIVDSGSQEQASTQQDSITQQQANIPQKLPKQTKIQQQKARTEMTPEELAKWKEVASQLKNLAPGEGPAEYTVQPGDTLWDISDQLLDDPFWWPKLWSLNPEITNPNVISPGTKLVFYPGLKASIAPTLAMKDLGEVLPVSTSASFITKWSNTQLNHPWQGKEGTIVSAGELPTDSSLQFGGMLPTPATYLAPVFGTLDIPNPIGEVVIAGAGRSIGTRGSYLYADFSTDVTPGEKFLAVRKVDAGSIPGTQDILSTKVYVYSGIVGVSRINQSKRATLIVENSQFGVQSGDKLIPFRNILIPVSMVPTGRTAANFRGKVISAGIEGSMTIAGTANFLLLEKEEGNANIGEEIVLYMPEGGTVRFDDDSVDRIPVGIARIIDVGEEHVSAIILSSQREISIGSTTYAR